MTTDRPIPLEQKAKIDEIVESAGGEEHRAKIEAAYWKAYDERMARNYS